MGSQGMSNICLYGYYWYRYELPVVGTQVPPIHPYVYIPTEIAVGLTKQLHRLARADAGIEYQP